MSLLGERPGAAGREVRELSCQLCSSLSAPFVNGCSAVEKHAEAELMAVEGRRVKWERGRLAQQAKWTGHGGERAGSSPAM